jgi:NAD(P)-dependent dehydrogenase (short-subunit alcohol dehydrogenase family)
MSSERRPVVVVTGAGGHGVGSGVCTALAERGARLVLNDVHRDGVEEAAARYPDAIAVAADLRTAEGVDAVLDAGIAAFGEIDALVNNAGIGLSLPAHLAEEADFDRLFSLNVRGMWLASRAFATHRIAQGGGGAIVNISSVHGQHTQNGYAIYAATKGAVEGLTRGMSVELGVHGIRCNAVAPGAVLDERFADRYGFAGDPVAAIRNHAAEQQAIERAVGPADVGRVVAFLTSPEAWAVAGQTVTVDAGLSTLLYDRIFTGDAPRR